jgi:hypothetical protein
MRAWLSVFILILGVAIGAAGMWLVSHSERSYLPESLRAKVEHVPGQVVRKQRDADRLLLSIVTAQGAVLASFSRRVPEIDLLIDQGDSVTLALPRYKPFLQDPTIEAVQKPRSGLVPGDAVPPPRATP